MFSIHESVNVSYCSTELQKTQVKTSSLHQLLKTCGRRPREELRGEKKKRIRLLWLNMKERDRWRGTVEEIHSAAESQRIWKLCLKSGESTGEVLWQNYLRHWTSWCLFRMSLSHKHDVSCGLKVGEAGTCRFDMEEMWAGLVKDIHSRSVVKQEWPVNQGGDHPPNKVAYSISQYMWRYKWRMMTLMVLTFDWVSLSALTVIF